MFAIHIAGTEIEFGCAPTDTIMRAGLRAGVALPYECNTGGCGTCKMELISGEIVSLRPDSTALAERDRARHRVLGCQAQPRTDCVVKVRTDPAATDEPRPAETTGILAAIEEVTHDIREFSFELPAATLFLPGQYALLRVPGVGAQRAYSMSNTPGSTRWQFQIKRAPGGLATGVLFDQLGTGAQVPIDGPYGHAYLRPDASRDVVCIAGGSGIAPVLSIVRGMAETPALSSHRLHVVYGGRRPADICGEDVLRALPALQGRYTYTPVISSPEDDASRGWTGRTGFVHDAVPEIVGDALPGCELYFAGPPAMTLAVQRMLMQAKVPRTQVHFDQFF